MKQLSEEFGHYSKKYQNWEKWGKTEETGTFISDLDEGELTEIKKQLVQKNTLADAIDNLGMADEAGAICRIDGTVLINRDIFDEYLEQFHQKPCTYSAYMQRKQYEKSRKEKQ